MSHARTRIIIGVALTVAFAAVLTADVPIAQYTGLTIAPCFWLLLLAGLWIGSWEFFRMLRLKGHPCRPGIALAFTTLIVFSAWMEIHRPWGILPWLYGRGLELYLLMIVALVFTTFVAEIGRVEQKQTDVGRALASVGWTVLVVLTVGLLGVFLAKIRFLSREPLDGLLYLALTAGVVKGSDIGAYAIGSTLGRHKLVPIISPNKTIEGLAGAILVGIGMALAIGCGWGRFNALQMVIFGTAVSIAGVLGDLAESLTKRACGVKDSGSIPTFGGALDILDSMLAAAPVAYLLLVLLTDGSHAG